MKTNYFINAENTTALQEIPDASIDLVYADPPFNTGRDFHEAGTGYSDKEHTARPLPEQHDYLHHIATPSEIRYFSNTIPCIEEIHRILKPTGALYWHIDWKTNHIYRIVLNAIFGRSQFRNEIVWHYNSQSVYDCNIHNFKNNLDNILFYAKKEHDFAPQFYPLTAKQIRELYVYKDADGRRYKPNKTRTHLQGRIYADEDQGSRIGTCWTDIDIIRNPKERTGYPTQKPIALLNRIIKASSNENDIVLDPYCGAGTTCLSAKQHKRRYIGIDQNPEAIAIAQRRLQ